MKHLSETELLDALDGRLAPERLRHRDACVSCGVRLSELQSVLSRVSEVEVPEPSPLFWDHFSARVRHGIGEDLSVRRGSWFDAIVSWRGAMAAAAIIAIVGVAMALALRPDPMSRTAEVSVENDAPAPAGDPAQDDVDVDEAWAVVRAVADGVVWEDVNDAGISARPGSAERMVMGLSESERGELAALLEEELRRSGA